MARKILCSNDLWLCNVRFGVMHFRQVMQEAPGLPSHGLRRLRPGIGVNLFKFFLTLEWGVLAKLGSSRVGPILFESS